MRPTVVTDDAHDREPSFEERCDALSKRIDSGQVPSSLQIARALDLPLTYVETAIAHAAVGFFRYASGRKH
jgi:hypothetical protein